MSALGFLAIAGVICLVGFGVLYLRSRQPSSLESGIDAFRAEMHALSPDDERPDRRPGAGGGSNPPGPRPGPRR